MLQVSGVSKAFGPTRALIDVSFSAASGQVLALVGENGSGKSTLMRILSRELMPDQGSVTYAGHPVHEGDVFLVHQELALCPHMTVAENMFLGRFGGPRFSPRKIEARARQVLELLGYPGLDPSATVGSLPISLRQVVEIARSEANECPVVLFDEPTSSLTKEDAMKLFGLIDKLKGQGRTILFISHFIEEVRTVADRAVILRDGALVGDGVLAAMSDQQIVTHMVGREVDDLFPRTARASGEAVLSVEGLFGRRDKPRGADLALHKGEVVGIAGLNGAGRTELLRAVMGLDAVVKGRVQVAALSPRTIADRWLKGVGFVSEDRKSEGLALGLSIAENITMPMRRGVWSRPGASAARAEGAARRMNVKCRDVDQKASDLSGGNQQKVALARLLDSHCDVLLLDEPTRGIDIGSKAEIYATIDELASQGKAVLVVSSYLPELLGICDRVAVMNRGVLSAFQPAKEATQESLLELCLQ